MNAEERKALRALAEQVHERGQGRWRATEDRDGFVVQTPYGCLSTPQAGTALYAAELATLARYVAALSPERVIGLLDAHGEVQLERDSAREERDYFMRQLEAERQETARLRAEVERLKAEARPRPLTPCARPWSDEPMPGVARGERFESDGPSRGGAT